VQSSIKMM